MIDFRKHLRPGEAFLKTPNVIFPLPMIPVAVVKPARKPKAERRPVYVEIACPECGTKQQAANRCVKCKTMIIWRMDELMQSQIQRAYNLTGRNAKAAAKLMGIPYRTFWTRLQQYKATALTGVIE